MKASIVVLQSLWKKAAPGMRALLLLVLLVSSVSCRETILHDLDELRANRVTLILAQANITAQKVRDGSLWSVSVSAGDVTAALKAIEQSRAIKPYLKEITSQSSSIVQSREERSQMIERGLALALEQTLERLPDVLEARVHLHLEAEDRLNLIPVPKEGSASVLLVTLTGKAANETHVRQLVASASGVKQERVAVVTVPGQVNKPGKKSGEGTVALAQDAEEITVGTRAHIEAAKEAAKIEKQANLQFPGFGIVADVVSRRQIRSVIGLFFLSAIFACYVAWWKKKRLFSSASRARKGKKILSPLRSSLSRHGKQTAS
jgi:type III secretory pathway lipoprotein EscJ